MTIAIVSDLHGNFTALQAVVKDFPKDVTEMWCLGDVVGYGAQPRECMEWVQLNCRFILKGNHEAMILADPAEDFKYRKDVQEETSWTRKQFTKEDRSWISSEMNKIIQEKDVTLVHGGFPDYIWTYTLTSQDALRSFGYTSKITFLGHTHKPVIFSIDENDRVTSHSGKGEYTIDAPSIINVGSVGQPRNGDPRASYVLFYGDSLAYRKVEYDIKEAQRLILEAGLPEVGAKRLETGT